jgi:hypothetical protein
VSGTVDPVSAELCEMELEPAKPMLCAAVLYQYAPLDSVGTLSEVGCLTTAAVDTAPSAKHVAALVWRAATKRNGPAHTLIVAGVTAVLYEMGKPLQGVQPCARSSALGTL